jgi:hypothetical protein
MEWHESHEKVLVELSEESQISSYMHKLAHEYYSRKNIQYQLPIIILSVLSGSANFISSSFEKQQAYIVLGVGGISIMTSIISSISQFLKLGEYAEGHRIANNAWEKFYARINIQLKMRRENRENANEFLIQAQSEYLRLKEMSPDVPVNISREVSSKNKHTLVNMHAPVLISGFRPVKPFLDAVENDITEDNTVHAGPLTPIVAASPLPTHVELIDLDIHIDAEQVTDIPLLPFNNSNV